LLAALKRPVICARTSRSIMARASSLTSVLPVPLLNQWHHIH
jgi:hypothetical protein